MHIFLMMACAEPSCGLSKAALEEEEWQVNWCPTQKHEFFCWSEPGTVPMTFAQLNGASFKKKVTKMVRSKRTGKVLTFKTRKKCWWLALKNKRNPEIKEKIIKVSWHCCTGWPESLYPLPKKLLSHKIAVIWNQNLWNSLRFSPLARDSHPLKFS